METQQVIQQQRQAIEQAKKQAQEVAKREAYTKKQLLQQGLAQRAQRQALQQQKQKASRQQIQQIKAQEKQFETSVSQQAPTLAKTSYLESAYKEAQKSYQSKVDTLKQKLSKYQDRLKEAKREDDNRKERDYKDEIEEINAELGVYSGALKSSKAEAVKGYYSGYTKSLAEYKRDVQEARNKEQEQKRDFAQTQGFKTYKQYEQAFDAQKLAGVSSPVYVDELGQGISVSPSQIPSQSVDYSQFFKGQDTGMWTPYNQIEPNVVKAVEDKKGLAGVQQKLQEFKTQYGSQVGRPDDSILKQYGKQGIGLGLGLASSGVGLISAVTHPLETGKNIIVGVPKTAVYVAKGGKFPEVSRMIRQNPGYLTGFVAGEVLTGYGAGKGIGKIADVKNIKRFKDLEKAKPEASVSITKDNQYLTLIKRKTPYLEAETLQTYKVIPETGQVIKGKGVTQIRNIKSGELLDPTKFTFSGETFDAKAWRNLKGVKTPLDIDTFAGKSTILTEDLHLYKNAFGGISKKQGDFTKIVYGDLKGRIKSTKEILRADMKEGIVLPSWEYNKYGVLEPRGVGVIRKLPEPKKDFFIKKIGKEKVKDAKVKDAKVKDGKVKEPEPFFKSKPDKPIKRDVGKKSVQELKQVSKESSQAFGLVTEQKILSKVRPAKVKGKVRPTGLLKDESVQVSTQTTSLRVSDTDKIKVFQALPDVKPKTIIDVKGVVTTLPKPKQDFFLGNVQVPVFKPITKTKTIVTHKPATATRPRVRPFRPFGFPLKKKIVLRKKTRRPVSSRDQGAYTSFIKRFGKWKKVASGSRAQVTKKAKNRVRNTLGASFKVTTPSGKSAKLKTSKEFRKSKNKNTPNVLIEKSKYRLNSPSEKKEIKSYRKK